MAEGVTTKPVMPSENADTADNARSEMDAIFNRDVYEIYKENKDEDWISAVQEFKAKFGRFYRTDESQNPGCSSDHSAEVLIAEHDYAELQRC